MKNTCGSCKNYTGLGDWNLCCTESHDPKEYPFGHLCYEDTPACDKYKPSVNMSQKNYTSKEN